MTNAPERIWIDAWGGNWSPVSGGTQEIQYTRTDLIPAMIEEAVQAEREAIAAMMDADAAAYEAEEDQAFCRPIAVRLRAKAAAIRARKGGEA